MPSPFPAWLLHSGLPQRLNSEPCGSAAWLLLKTIIEMDCRRSITDKVDTSLQNLATVTGLTVEQVVDTFPVFRKTQVARYYMPEDQEENALIQVNEPIPTPISHKDVLKLQIPDPAVAIHRYCTCPEAQQAMPGDPVLNEIIDLYLGQCSVRMNSFILDRLTYLRHSADIGAIRWAFKTCEKNNCHSLDAVVRIALKIADKRIQNK